MKFLIAAIVDEARVGPALAALRHAGVAEFRITDAPGEVALPRPPKNAGKGPSKKGKGGANAHNGAKMFVVDLLAKEGAMPRQKIHSQLIQNGFSGNGVGPMLIRLMDQGMLSKIGRGPGTKYELVQKEVVNG